VSACYSDLIVALAQLLLHRAQQRDLLSIKYLASSDHHICVLILLCMCPDTTIYQRHPSTMRVPPASIRQHMSAYATHVSACVLILLYISVIRALCVSLLLLLYLFTSYVSMHQHASYIRQHTSIYISIRQHTSSCYALCVRILLCI
jgi:hypothetical protein